ncbi:hypothetical protein BZA77DRAFT_388319 [Pyronema omphalodes]|nr:hypothetical protein BZA77DRAFT_388319 [Pyronema omphalodes]
MAVPRKPRHKSSAQNHRKRNRNNKPKNFKVHGYNTYQKTRVNDDGDDDSTGRPNSQQHHRANQHKKQKPQQPKIHENSWPPVITNTPGDDPLEKIVNTTRPVKHGYIFVRAGNVYITRTIKRLCKQQKICLYTVIIGRTTLGVQVPASVYHAAVELEKDTEAARRKAVDSKDIRERKEAMGCLKGLFTKIPEKDAERVVGYAFKKRTGRVGRTGNLPLEERLRMATIAHIRHTHTDYDERLKAAGPGLSPQQRKKNQEKARNAVTAKIEQVWTSWGPPKKLPWCRLDGGNVRGKGFAENRNKNDDEVRGLKDQHENKRRTTANKSLRNAPRKRSRVNSTDNSDDDEDDDDDDSISSLEDFIDDTSDEEEEASISDESDNDYDYDYNSYDEDYLSVINDDSDLEIIEHVRKHNISEPTLVQERNTTRFPSRVTRNMARKLGIQPDVEMIELSD